MDCKSSGPLMCFVLVLTLLKVNRCPVFAAPIPPSCDFTNTKLITELLQYETKDLLDKYIEHHGPRNELIPDDIPSSTISGANISEKLQDIYMKNILFNLHLSQVDKYQTELLTDPQPVLEPLRLVKGRLSSHLQSIKAVLMHVDPDITVLPTPSTPQPSLDDTFEKKVYGWGVIYRLKDWIAQVLLVLEEANKVCLEKKGSSSG